MFQVSHEDTHTHIQFSHGKGNPIDLAFIHRFFDTLNDLPTSARAVIIEGIPQFSVGMNLELLSGMNPMEVETLFSLYEKLLNKLETAPYITIAKMNGYAMGAGAELSLACDFRWMEQKAKIGFPGVNVGFTYNTKRLPSLIPRQIAKRLILTGTTLNAHQAMSFGIADRVLGKNRMDQELFEFVKQFSSKSPIALKYAKASFHDISPERALTLSIEAEHYREGAAAFVDGRPPKWQGV